MSDAFDMRRYVGVVAGVAAMAAAIMCGGNSATPCTPGQSLGCSGVGGCTGYQVCKSDGTYDLCICPSSDGGPSDASSDALADVGADAPLDVQTDSGAWTPASLAELQLWYEGSHIDGDAGPITSWRDESPNQKTLTPVGAPTFVSNAINGKPGALISNATNDGIVGPMPAIGTTPYVAEVIARTALSTSAGTLWVMGSNVNDSTHCNFQFNISPAGIASARYTCTSPDIATMAFAASQPHMFGIRRTSLTQAQVRIDGASTAMALTNSEGVGAPTTLGLGTMDVIITEVVLATNPSDNDVSQLEGYLKTKYGL